MKSREAAARFAAYTWYTECSRAPHQAAQSEAIRFAKENWHAFLEVANEGWGRLLLRVAGEHERPQQRSTKSTRTPKPQLAAAS